MIIRRAEVKDTDRLIDLLKEVMDIHAKLRPDIFISGTTKYNEDELKDIIEDDTTPVFVAEKDGIVSGYAFCQLKEQSYSDNNVSIKTLYIDDLCVDSESRGEHIGQSLFEFVKKEAKSLGCYDITLNVWTGNEKAEAFYEKMGMSTKKRELEYIL